jgi:tetratricopeptide (TPR) repeat protein
MMAATIHTASASESETKPDELSLWSDPTFQKQFLGSYGVQAELEPRVTAVEREQMEELLPLLSSDAQAAAAKLEEITEPESSAIFDFTLGNVYFQLERLDRASERYRTAVEKFPSFRRAHKNLGLIHVRRGRFDEAIQSLSRVIELGGGDGLTYGLLGYAYSSTEQYLSAESAYREAVLLQADVLDWKLGLTLSVFKQRKYNEAVTLCEELIARYPSRADFWLMQANAYIGLDQPMKAAQNYEVVRRMGKATAQSLQTLGDIYVNQSSWELAAEAYADAIDLNPEQGTDRPLRNVEVLAQRGALDEAKQLLGRVKQAYGTGLDDDDRRKLLKLEARMAVADGEGADAVPVLEEIVALDPLDGEALILLGQHYARMSDPEKAIFYYERAESIEKFEADARVRHAQLLVEQARYEEAVPLLKRAQEIEPREDVARFLAQVERVARTQR